MDKILLDKNENKYGPSPKCLDVLCNLPSDSFTDYTRNDNRALLEKLAERFHIPMEHIFLGYGSEDLINQVFDIFLKPKKSVLLCSHGWYYYSKLCKKRKLMKHQYYLYRDGNRFTYDYSKMRTQFKRTHPKLTIVGSPSNPTGTIFDTSEFETLLQKARKNQILLYDMAYHGFSKQDDPPVAEWITKYDNLIMLGSFSKYYAMAGSRIGFAFVSRKLINSFTRSKRFLGFSRLLEQLAIAALDSEDYFHEAAVNIANDRNKIIKKLNSIPGFTAFDSGANFILTEYPVGVKEAFQQELTKRNIVIKFISDEPVFENMVRITVGTQKHTQLFLEALDSLAEHPACSQKSNELYPPVESMIHRKHAFLFGAGALLLHRKSVKQNSR